MPELVNPRGLGKKFLAAGLALSLVGAAAFAAPAPEPKKDGAKSAEVIPDAVPRGRKNTDDMRT